MEERQKCFKTKYCRLESVDGYCQYTKDCAYKEKQNTPLKSPTNDFKEKGLKDYGKTITHSLNAAEHF